MEAAIHTIKKLLELASINDFNIDSEEEGRRISLFIYDKGVVQKEDLPALIENINHIVQLIAKRGQWAPVYIDINNYRKERERIIKDLARAAARKAVVTKQDVELPEMNAYERRLVHVELAVHPNVRTESAGERRSRRVIIRPILDE